MQKSQSATTLQKYSVPELPANGFLYRDVSWTNIGENGEKSAWDRMLEQALTASTLDTRAFRAGVVFNPLRGLSVDEDMTFSAAEFPPTVTDGITTLLIIP